MPLHTPLSSFSFIWGQFIKWQRWVFPSHSTWEGIATACLPARVLGPWALKSPLSSEMVCAGPLICPCYCSLPSSDDRVALDRKWGWTECDLRAFFFAFLICWHSCRVEASAPFLGTTLSFGYQLRWSILAFSILLFIVTKGELGLGV